MIAQDMDNAIIQALDEGLVPVMFKVLVPFGGIRPTDKAKRKGIPIDITSRHSYLLCENGQIVLIDGGWAD